MVNPDSVPGQTDGLPEPGDLTSTIPDVEAAEQSANQPPAATETEVVEEYLQE
jgi:hypothetical protein